MASDVEKKMMLPNKGNRKLMARLGMPNWDSPEGRVWISRLRDNVPFIAITLVILLFWFISGDRFMSVRNWTFIAQQTPVLLLLAFAQLLVVTTGSIDISVGSNLGFSAYMAALGMLWFGELGFIVGIFAAMLIGVLNGAIFSLFKISSFVTTLAMLIIVRAVLVIVSDGRSIYVSDQPMSNSNITSIEAKWLLDLGQFPQILYFTVFVAVLLWIVYEKTVFGQQLKALGGNEKVLRLTGISVNWFKIQVFAAAGFMVGLASFINLARSGAATVQAGEMLELDAIAAVALGGTVLTGGYGSVLKTVVGALTLTIVANGLTIAGVPPSWSRIARGLLLITAIAISLNRKQIDVVK